MLVMRLLLCFCLICCLWLGSVTNSHAFYLDDAQVADTHVRKQLVTPEPGQVCPQPYSIVTHSYDNFQSIETLLSSIKDLGILATTYRGYFSMGGCMDKKLVVSLDDMPTYSLSAAEKYFEIIEKFNSSGVPVVVGVVTQSSDVQSSDVWARLKVLSDKGMVEIASHTKSHPNLGILSSNEIYNEIGSSYTIICDNAGICPVSLILPYGSGWYSKSVLETAKLVGYRYIVSISAPQKKSATFIGYEDVSDLQNVVARMGLFSSNEETIQRLLATFK